ncbi:MAG: sigma-54 dependent transcriptional regulator [Lentisphaeraceae bacterium]|nr:sigma-54 dependent transcriptional regulator [Lentisphaeraceae bacterium]
MAEYAGKAVIVDDDVMIQTTLQDLLEDWGFECICSGDPQELSTRLSKINPDLIVSDLQMPGMSALELLEKNRASVPKSTWIVMTGNGSIDTSVKAIKLGADDYVLKPIDYDGLKLSIEKGMKNRKLTRENIKLRKALKLSSTIIGSSKAVKNLMSQIDSVAPSFAPVLIHGESGTGKELVAQELHKRSQNSKSKFMGIDCVALPKEIFESELFGYEKGAFTGAVKQKIGLMETTGKGTFFMDEITELDFSLQAKLLRTLQERKFRRVGGTEFINLDCRLVSATRRDPLQAIRDEIFREDLYYRLNVVPIHLPPLRERREDIPLLVKHFLSKSKYITDDIDYEISSGALDRLMSYSWPGNIRELQNLIERLMIFAKEGQITEDSLPAEICAEQRTQTFKKVEYIETVKAVEEERPLSSVSDSVITGSFTSESFKDAKAEAMESFEKSFLEKALTKHRWNITEAAETSGVNRKTFQRLIAKYNIK